MRKYRYQIISAAALIGALALWEIGYRIGWIPGLFFSSPSRIVEAFIRLSASGELLTNVVASAQLVVVGVLLSIVTAIPLGVLIGWSKLFSAVVDPFVSILYATPRIALIPLIFVWFGIGFPAQVVIVYLVAVFPLIINTAQGIRNVDPQLVQMAKSFGSSDARILWTIGFPNALPFIVAGLRMTLMLSLIGFVVAEFFTGNVGLGAMITRAATGLRTDVAFVGVFIIAIAALILSAVLERAEKSLGRWKLAN